MSRRRSATGPPFRGPIRWELVPKPGGDMRRLVVLTPPDQLAFTRSVARAIPAIQRVSDGASHANRIVAWDPARGPLLEPWTRARARWRRDVRHLGNDRRFVAVTDARACYASISPIVVTRRLIALGAPETCVDEIASWLCAFGDAGVEGLPVGPVVSALLADAVLSAGDDAIRGAGAAHVRWVDDVAIFAPDARTRTDALRALRRSWSSFGLELHDGKTVLFDDPAAGDMCAWTTSDARRRAPRCDNRAT
jgi:Reverse transcriptase (RNA-dependent DNA polymerase)